MEDVRNSMPDEAQTVSHRYVRSNGSIAGVEGSEINARAGAG